MKDLIVLNKKETALLEYNSYHVSNIPNFSDGPKIYREYLDSYFDIIGWYHVNDLTTSDTQKKHFDKFIELMSVPPTYYARRGSQNYRTAIWGFSFETCKFLIYLNKRGLAMQFSSVTENEYCDILDILTRLLLKNKKEALS